MFDMFGSAGIEKSVDKIVAALLTAAFANVRLRNAAWDIDDLWDVYQNFLNKQDKYLISKEDWAKIAEAVKKAENRD